MALEEDFAAAGATKSEARIKYAKGDSPVFIAEGCVVDKIVSFLGRNGLQNALPFRTKSEIPFEFANYSKLVENPSDWLKDSLDVATSNYIKQTLGEFLSLPSSYSGEAKIQAFLKAITYDRLQTREMAGSTLWEPFHKLLRNGDISSISPSIQSSDNDFQQSRDYIRPLLDRVRESFLAGFPYTQQRELYITKGGLIGLSELAAKKSGYICAWKGCFRPLVIRSTLGRQVENGKMMARGVSGGCSYL